MVWSVALAADAGAEGRHGAARGASNRWYAPVPVPVVAPAAIQERLGRCGSGRRDGGRHGAAGEARDDAGRVGAEGIAARIVAVARAARALLGSSPAAGPVQLESSPAVGFGVAMCIEGQCGAREKRKGRRKGYRCLSIPIALNFSR
ncbi:hypothetical protein U9M48_015532 [Paspalum notatum var. saurae]|uniref:Uncharacterized protein n=1 Tax=Paspalum notatum var. saurae TaxID=547442 RepID=A0AAQ3T5G7_PASNO